MGKYINSLHIYVFFIISSFMAGILQTSLTEKLYENGHKK